MDSVEDPSALAIVGYSFRAPSVGRKGLWEFLVGARSAFSRVPADRFNQDAFYCPNAEKPGYFSSKGAHFLPDDIYAFDAPFFNIRPEEARAIDPQHRLALECAFEAVENAGIPLSDLIGQQIGVFAAHQAPEYSLYTSEDVALTNAYSATGIAGCMFANRISYFFDLRGPSSSVDAACAGSTYALHQACQSVRSGECKAALVVAAAVISGPELWIMLDQLGALSADGISYAYDRKASGFGRGEGGGCLVIKPLSEALASGDAIRAVIRNTAASHSGRTPGVTVPSQVAQEALERRVHAEVGLNPKDTAVVEGHGTGTPVGDPIDAGAIAAVFTPERSASNPLYLGSIKSNIGHLEGASGLLSVIKSIMMLEHRMILPTAHFEELNPKIVEGRDKLRVLKEAIPWPQHASGGPRRVCVTNYGMGGANAAVLLEHAPETKPRQDASLIDGIQTDVDPGDNSQTGADVLRLFSVSAASDSSLNQYLTSLAQYLDTAQDTPEVLEDISYTLGQRRTHFQSRFAAVAASRQDLRDQLSTAAGTIKSTRTKEIVPAFVFTGQGAQHARMAAGLRHFPSFGDALTEASTYLAKLGATWDLEEELDRCEDATRVHDAEISQPVCTIIQIALVHLLRTWGIIPAIVTGHSSGEIAAAFCAGLLSFEAAVAIAYFRGLVATRVTTPGAMLALGGGPEEAKKLIEENLGDSSNGLHADTAAINSHKSVTISGDVAAIDTLQQAAERQGLFARRLKVGLAYHSKYMREVATSYLELIKPYHGDTGAAAGSTSDAIFISSVTGRVESAVDASYWVQNLVQPVRFSDAFKVLVRADETWRPPTILIEIGPHPALMGPSKQILEQLRGEDGFGFSAASVSYLPSLARKTEPPAALLNLARGLFTLGADLKLGQVNQTSHSSARLVTDLPPYEWNHETRYIHQPRVTAQRFRAGNSYNALLGRRTPYCEGDEVSFRNVFTLDDLPWLRHHVVAGEYLFPFTGFYSLAVEALRVITPGKMESVLLQELHVGRSLKMVEDQRVDLTTKLRPSETGTAAKSSSMWTFEVLSWSDAHGWASHARGRVSCGGRALSMSGVSISKAVRALDEGEFDELDPVGEYQALADCGITYGPAFQTMTEFWASSSSDVTMHVTKLRKLEPPPYTSLASSVTIDPPTLDAFFHGLNIFYEKGDGGVRGVYVPTYVSRLHISNNIETEPGQMFTVVSRLLKHNTQNGHMQASVTVFTDSFGIRTPILDLEAVTVTRVKRPTPEQVMSRLPESYRETIVPHIAFIGGEDLSRMLTETGRDDTAELELRRKQNLLCIHFMAQALEETAEDDYSSWPSHLQKLRKLSQFWVDRWAGIPESVDLTTLKKEVVGTTSAGKLGVMIGEQLTTIMRGELQPLELMLQDDLLGKTYKEQESYVIGSRAMARYVRLLATTTPNLRILEIGGGTGGSTVGILEALSSEGTLPFIEYVFTDISSGFFEKARETLARWPDRITYRKLDISQDPSSQGFAAEDFDLIVAAQVLHATPNLSTTILHARSLLRPKGKILLQEGVNPQPIDLVFATLPGWWLAEDEYRTETFGYPLLSRSGWDKILTAQGFSGIDGAIEDYPGCPELNVTVIWSTAVEPAEEPAPAGDITQETAKLVVCSLRGQKFADQVSVEVSRSLQRDVPVQELSQLEANPQTFYILVDDVPRSVFEGLTREEFQVLKQVLLNSTGILWVSPKNATPEGSMVKGLLRTIRLEDPTRKRLLLEKTPYTTQGAELVARLVTKSLVLDETPMAKEEDLVVDKGLLHVPRLEELTTAKEAWAEAVGIVAKKEQAISQDAAFEMTVDSCGDLDSSIYFQRTDALTPGLDGDEIVVQVEVAAVNFRDVLMVLGQIPWDAPGREGAGVVTRVGANVTSVQPGDRVFFVFFKALKHTSAFANYVRVPSWYASKVPAALSLAEATTLPVAYATAIVCLERVARLRAGEIVLVHSAAGAVGQACISIGQYIGARVFATAGTPEKREFLRKRFGLQHVYSSRDDEFKDQVVNATDGRGVDVVVNSLSGHLLQQTWEVMAEGGRFVEIGRKDFLQNSNLSMRPFDRNVIFAGVDLAKRPSAELREVLSTVIDLATRGVIEPIRPLSFVPISQLQQGLRKLQQGQIVGKLIVTVSPDEVILGEVPRRLDLAGAIRSSLLSPEATYLVTGGTGGIGRSLAPWLLQQGAGHVVLLGRDPSKRHVVDLVRRHKGRIHAVSCDVAQRSQLVQALDNIRHLGPVKGVVHGALYLRDAIFPNASFEDWERITGPKIAAAWHLHELLPELDFFVSLGSAGGVFGNVGQAIYSGTSQFLSAFAKHRLARGLPAVTIHLPVVENVGYVVKAGIQDKMRSSYGMTLTAAQVHTAVRGAIIGHSSGLNSGGEALSFSRPALAASTGAATMPWESLNLSTAMRATHRSRGGRDETAGRTDTVGEEKDMVELLTDKVAAMAMMDREELTPERSLEDVGLDSLVAVELRNFIRRQWGVELALTQIVGADVNLRVLADLIQSTQQM